MPWDGNGNWLRTYNWTQDAANGINITASRFDTEDNGFAAALGNCITRDGQGVPGSAQVWSVPLTVQNVVATGDGSKFTGGTNTTVLFVTSNGGNYALQVQGGLTPSASHGLAIRAGTNISDVAFEIFNASSTQVLYTQDGAGNIFARGVARCVYKSAITTRTVATVSPDPDLSIPIGSPGTYAFRIVAPFYAVANALAIGLAVGISYSGTYNLTSSFYGANIPGTSGPGRQVLISNSTAQYNAVNLIAATTSTTPMVCEFFGTLTMSGVGNLSLNWAQNTQSANGLVLTAGAFMTLTQLS